MSQAEASLLEEISRLEEKNDELYSAKIQYESQMSKMARQIDDLRDEVDQRKYVMEQYDIETDYQDWLIGYKGAGS